MHKVLFYLIFRGFARALKFIYGVLIHGVQQSFQHQTEGIGRNHDPSAKHNIRFRGRRDIND
jgi:hypothetical protein